MKLKYVLFFMLSMQSIWLYWYKEPLKWFHRLTQNTSTKHPPILKVHESKQLASTTLPSKSTSRTTKSNML